MRANFDLQTILQKVEIEDFCQVNSVDYRMTTGSSGSQLNVRECPRCGGTDWKVFLNTETGLGNCFHGSCVGQPGFNKFSFAKNYLHLSNADTVAYFKDFAKKRKWILGTAAKTHATVDIQKVLKLPESIPISRAFQIPYLENRGFDAETAEHFGWRFCEKGFYEFTNDKGEAATQRYDNRVIIPIFDISGKPVNFQGRDITGTSDRKYLFPPGLPGTGRFLYGAHKAIGVPNVIMNEGVFDVAAVYLAFKDFDDVTAIGSFGKSLSGKATVESVGQDQLNQLLKLRNAGMKRLVIMWDGEKTAIHSACSVAEELMSAGIDTFIAILPQDKDPNECSQEEVRAAYVKALRATKANLVRIRLGMR